MMNAKLRADLEKEITTLEPEEQKRSRAILSLSEEIIAVLDQGRKRDWVIPLIMALHHRVVEDKTAHSIAHLRMAVEGLEAVKHDLAARMLKELKNDR